jgi:hypothetical protein
VTPLTAGVVVKPPPTTGVVVYRGKEEIPRATGTAAVSEEIKEVISG